MNAMHRIKEPDERYPGMFLLYCQGCQETHVIWTHECTAYRNGWGFNGKMDTPTFTPSLKVTYNRNDGRGDMVCHSFITDGVIKYLSDCTHSLAGKTVNLLPVAEWPKND